MKREIHPDYQICAVTCGCGHSFTTRSTQPKITVEICSKCHPFFTGKQKFLDTAGMVEKFQKKYATAAYTTAKVAKVKKMSDKASAPKRPLALAPGNPTAPPPIPGKERSGRGGFRGTGKPGAPAAKDGAAPEASAKGGPAPKDGKPAKPAPTRSEPLDSARGKPGPGGPSVGAPAKAEAGPSQGNKIEGAAPPQAEKPVQAPAESKPSSPS